MYLLILLVIYKSDLKLLFFNINFVKQFFEWKSPINSAMNVLCLFCNLTPKIMGAYASNMKHSLVNRTKGGHSISESSTVTVFVYGNEMNHQILDPYNIKPITIKRAILPNYKFELRSYNQYNKKYLANIIPIPSTDEQKELKLNYEPLHREFDIINTNDVHGALLELNELSFEALKQMNENYSTFVKSNTF